MLQHALTERTRSPDSLEITLGFPQLIFIQQTSSNRMQSRSCNGYWCIFEPKCTNTSRLVIVVMYFINKLYREGERAVVHNNKVNMIFKIQKNNSYCKLFIC